jgi:hypothetical protein
MIRYLIGGLPELTELKPGSKNSPAILKNPPHPEVSPIRPVFCRVKTPEPRIEPKTGTSGKTPPKTSLTGRSKSSRSGQSGAEINPDGHFLGHEGDQVTSGDQISDRGTSRIDSKLFTLSGRKP